MKHRKHVLASLETSRGTTAQTVSGDFTAAGGGAISYRASCNGTAWGGTDPAGRGKASVSGPGVPRGGRLRWGSQGVVGGDFTAAGAWLLATWLCA